MIRKKVPSLVAGIIISIVICAVAGAERLPSANPEEFRNDRHGDYSLFKPDGRIALPEILPVANSGALQANFDDLLISETTGPANFTQDRADLAALKGGRSAAVWEDNRLGPTGIQLQLFDGFGIRINGNAALVLGDSYNLNDPVIAVDTAGNFYVVWREDANGFLQAARFDSLANLLTPIFFVSDTVFAGYAGEFEAACLPDGRLVVVWETYTFGNDIAFRIFDTDGAPVSAQLTANSDGPLNKHWSPAVAIGPDGDIAVVWEDYRQGRADIYFRLFDSEGLAFSPEAPISDESARDSARYLPAVAFSAVDDYLVGWVDLRDGQNIYLQKIDAAGALADANILLTDQSSQYANWELDLAVGATDRFLAAWTLYSTQNTIMLQRFQSGVFKDGDPLNVSGVAELQRFNPAVTGNEAGNIGVVWTDLASGSADIYGTFLDNSGTVLQAKAIVNDDATGSPSFDPAVTHFNQYEWTIVFTDQRRDAGDILLQRVYVGGTLYGGNRLVNSDAPGGVQSQPAVISGADKALVSWTDVRQNGVNGQNIFCRFTLRNDYLTDEIVVNDDYAGSAAHYESDCAINAGGQSLVIWTDTRSGNAKIYGQLFDANNALQGANFLIGPAATVEMGEMAKVSLDNSGNFVVAYLNRLASGGPAVEVKRVDPAGLVTDAFVFASDKATYQIDGFDARSAFGLLYLVWHGYSGYGPELFYTVLDSIGVNGLASLTITDDEYASPGLPDMIVDAEGYALITWSDGRTGSPTPFRQIFDPTYVPVESNVPVYTAAGPYMQPPAVAAFRGKGVFVWSDARANGLNVYAAQVIYSPTDAEDEGDALPSFHTLEQNYPNPFNPTTAIRFTLAKAGQVRLEIINLLGQTVRTLGNRKYPAGEHVLTWDGTSDDGRRVASGVYLYRLTSDDFSRTRKMILMK